MEIILREQRNIDFAVDQLRRVDLSKPHVVRISEFKVTRSDAQNRLYWLWLRAIGDFVGMTKDDLHMQFKARYVLPILLADNDPDVTEINNAVRVIWQAGLKEQATIAKRNMIRDTVSTKKLNVAQFTEYLTEIEGYARDGQIALPYPDDYRIAMGVK